MHFDVFNGDADGICALQQLRLTFPRSSSLVTGVKRDISLLRNIDGKVAKSLTVLDISLDTNRDDLMRLLGFGVEVEYFDHHFAGDVPLAPNLRSYIDLDPRQCTSLIVDRFLGGARRIWAVVAAFGDNLHSSAVDAARSLNLTAKQLEQLRHLGEALNYNSYGESEADLHYRPDDLYKVLSRYDDPFEFSACENIVRTLRDAYAEDIGHVRALLPTFANGQCELYLLADLASSRRINGTFANHLVQAHPSKAMAVLTPRRTGGFTVSVRAPLENPKADVLCRSFAGGGGRPMAAGINHLADGEFGEFTTRFVRMFS